MTVRAFPAHAFVVAPIVAVGASIALGAGCGVPFQVTRDVSVVLPLGVADPGCTNASTSRTLAGRDVTFDRHASNDGCTLASTATGPFLDLAAAKQQAGAAADGTHIDGVTIDVARVSLRNVDEARVRSLHADIDIDGAHDVVVVDGVPPHGSSHVSPELVHAIDDAWQRADDVAGTGTTDVVIDSGVAATPDLSIDLTIHVEGTKSLGG